MFLEDNPAETVRDKKKIKQRGGSINPEQTVRREYDSLAPGACCDGAVDYTKQCLIFLGMSMFLEDNSTDKVREEKQK